MMKKIVVTPILWLLSAVAGLTYTVGSRVSVHRIYWLLFDVFIGVQNAREWRDDHVQIVEDYVEENINVNQSPENLAAEVEETLRRTETKISNGESILGFSIAGAAFFLPPWVATGLTVLLIISVSVRLIAVETLGYTNSGSNEPPERLVAKVAWNGGVLPGSKVTSNMLILGIMKRLDERFYETWLHDVFAQRLVGDLSMIEVITKFWNLTWEIQNSKLNEGEQDNNVSQSKESEEGDAVVQESPINQ